MFGEISTVITSALQHLGCNLWYPIRHFPYFNCYNQHSVSVPLKNNHISPFTAITSCKTSMHKVAVKMQACIKLKMYLLLKCICKRTSTPTSYHRKKKKKMPSQEDPDRASDFDNAWRRCTIASFRNIQRSCHICSMAKYLLSDDI